MARDIWDYFEERERECKRLSLTPDPGFTIYSEERDSDGLRGRWITRLHLDDDAYLHCHESIVVEDDHVHRVEYGYFLVIQGQEYWGRERDPTYQPPEHGHGFGHTRVPAGRVTFRDAVEEAWRINSAEAELRDA